MSHTSTRIIRAAGLLACTSLVAVGISMSPGAVTPAMAVECSNIGAGGNTADDNGNQENTACGRFADADNGTAGTGKSSAYGWEAEALAGESTAIGAGTLVTSRSDHGVAIGRNATVALEGVGNGSDSAIAIGHNSNARGDDATAVGRSALTNGDRATAIGARANAAAIRSVAVGDGATATSSGAVAIGRSSNADGFESLAAGRGASADGSAATAVGRFADAGGSASVAVGDGASATGARSVAMGNDALATGAGSIAIGDGATATGSIAMGVNATAANSGSAYGDNTSATFSNSAAWGQNATATRANQQVFGTANNTYTMGGITSDASRSAQSGPLSIVTTDNAGNLASDGGELFSAASQNQAGVAMAMSLENPDLTGNERLGIAANVGFFEDSVALGFTGMGVVSQNLLGLNERIAVSGGVTFSVDEASFSGNNESDNVGGRVGTQMTW